MPAPQQRSDHDDAIAKLAAVEGDLRDAADETDRFARWPGEQLRRCAEAGVLRWFAPRQFGGVEIPHSHGLEGHSDADVLCHAIADAILGAIGERDIGHHFPNTDESIRGISSLEIVRKAVDLVARQGGRVLNVDASVVTEAPKIAPHLVAMKANLAEAIGISAKRVGLKATTNEHLGFIGRGEGIATLAVASVELPDVVV